MPTGYTADILDKNIDFPQFVWDCARAFGALIHMRDDKHDARVRKSEPDNYHQEALQDAQADLLKMKALTDDEAAALAVVDFKKGRQAERESRERAEVATYRLTAMIWRVQDWQPPSKDHQSLKTFMLEQLQSTLEFDGTYRKWYRTPPPLKTGPEYRTYQVKICLGNIEYHAKHLREDEERKSGQATWIDQLQDSVPYPGGRI